jgi:hypothetical protein
MPVEKCGVRISRGKGSDGEEMYPLVSHTCDLPKGHEGPHSSVSDMHSVEQRRAWMSREKDRQADQRHQASGLGRTQSRPLTSASITQPDTQKPHPSQATDCPFCNEKPLVKNFVNHIQEHAAEKEFEETMREREATGMTRLSEAIPQPPASFRVSRDGTAVETPEALQPDLPYPGHPQAPQGAGEGVQNDELLEAVAYLDAWMARQPGLSRMVSTAWSTIRDYLTAGLPTG